MRLTVLGQYAGGVAQVEQAVGDLLLSNIERIKRLLWRGNIHRAGPAVDNLQDDVEGLEVDYPLRGRFARAAREFAAHIAGNADSTSTMASGSAPASASRPPLSKRP